MVLLYAVWNVGVVIVRTIEMSDDMNIIMMIKGGHRVHEWIWLCRYSVYVNGHKKNCIS